MKTLKEIVKESLHEINKRVAIETVLYHGPGPIVFGPIVFKPNSDMTMKNKTIDVATQPHYNNFEIEPIEYITKNHLDFLEGNIIKYVTRYKLKNGVEDLRKARDYLDRLITRECNHDTD